MTAVWRRLLAWWWPLGGEDATMSVLPVWATWICDPFRRRLVTTRRGAPAGPGWLPTACMSIATTAEPIAGAGGLSWARRHSAEMPIVEAVVAKAFGPFRGAGARRWVAAPLRAIRFEAIFGVLLVTPISDVCQDHTRLKINVDYPRTDTVVEDPV